MKMVKVKTAELEGKALDWAAGIAASISVKPHKQKSGYFYTAYDAPRKFPFDPSSDWSKCGPLIESKKIWLSPPVDDPFEPYGWDAEIYDEDGDDVIGHARACETPLIAACRAIVATELGDEVEVPEVLL